MLSVVKLCFSSLFVINASFIFIGYQCLASQIIYICLRCNLDTDQACTPAILCPRNAVTSLLNAFNLIWAVCFFAGSSMVSLPFISKLSTPAWCDCLQDKVYRRYICTGVDNRVQFENDVYYKYKYDLQTALRYIYITLRLQWVVN